LHGLFVLIGLGIIIVADLSHVGNAVIFFGLAVVFAERKTLPVLRAKYPAKLRVPPIFNPHHIVGFALVPVGRRPDVYQTIHLGSFAWKFDFYGKGMLMSQAGQVSYAGKARRVIHA
jgi:hypothetical protein